MDRAGMGVSHALHTSSVPTHQPRSWPCASLLPELFSGINGLCLHYFHSETDVGKQGPHKNPIFSFLILMWPIGVYFGVDYILIPLFWLIFHQ